MDKLGFVITWVITLIFLFLFVSSFIKAIETETSIESKIVDCYDSQHNKILNLQCERNEDNPYGVLCVFFFFCIVAYLLLMFPFRE
jgi:hypothetical protein